MAHGRHAWLGALIDGDLILPHQLAEVFAVDIRLLRGVRDVALVAAEQRHDVVALETGDPLLLLFTEVAHRGLRGVGHHKPKFISKLPDDSEQLFE